MPPQSSLWRNQDFLLLWSGQVISTAGSLLSLLAFPLLILALTGSAAQAGFVGALRSLPNLFFNLPAGALIDRWNRKRVMIICDSGRMLLMASIPVALAFGYVTVVQLYLVSFMEGTLFVFFNLAASACLPQVVRKEQLSAATAQNQAAVNIATLLGPSLAGVLYGLGRSLPFLTDALSYAVSVISLLFIKTPFQKERVTVPGKLHTEVWEGLIWLWRQPLMRVIAVNVGMINLLIGSNLVVLVIVLAQHQHASSFVIGVIFAAGGLGGIVGALIVGRVQKKLSFGQIMIGTPWLWTVLLPLYVIAPNLVWIGAITAVVLTVAPIYNVVQYSYQLALTPDELQGRVASVMSLIGYGSQPIGLALTGILLQIVGVTFTVAILSTGLALLALAMTLTPSVRHVPTLTE
jgi:MFS family permease